MNCRLPACSSYAPSAGRLCPPLMSTPPMGIGAPMPGGAIMAGGGIMPPGGGGSGWWGANAVQQGIDLDESVGDHIERADEDDCPSVGRETERRPFLIEHEDVA